MPLTRFFRRCRRACPALGLFWAGTAAAVPFNLGTLEGQLDSTLSFTSGWGTQGPSARLVGAANGGSAPIASGDDGRRFAAGETFSKRFEGLHGLELKRGDSGLYLSGHYWYDFELADEQPIDDHGRPRHARSAGGEILDAFFYRHYRWDERAGTLRLGRQRLHWGEGELIGGGLDALNPRDAAAYHAPDSAWRDGALPVELAYLSQQLSDALSLEAFYQLRWRPDVAENCGTFFAQSDYLAEGCDERLALPVPGGPAAAGGEAVLIGRAGDHEADDGGQFGVALHYYAQSLDTDFGVYALNYHSRAALLGVQGGAHATADASAARLLGESRYRLAYPQDIHLYGLSFSTSPVSGSTWRGELSLRPNAPVQLASADLLYAPLTPLDSAYSPLTLAPGERLDGYRRKPVTQLQTSLTQVFDRLLGAEQMTLTGEIGWVHTGGLESDLRYGRDLLFGPGPLPGGRCQALAAQAGASARDCRDAGFTSADAWGYRLRSQWDYPDALAGLDLQPHLAWAHDVHGHSPQPQGTFVEGRKAFSLGLDADYRRTYQAGLAYTNFFGGRYSTWRDRDFLTLRLAVHF